MKEVQGTKPQWFLWKSYQGSLIQGSVIDQMNIAYVGEIIERRVYLCHVVAAWFREKHPQAVYVHCYVHELNVVLCHTCRAIPEASDFFETLESLYCFFSVSLVNQKFVDVQKQLGFERNELVQLSKTRWTCQLNSVKVLLENLVAVLRCLEESATSVAVGLQVKLSRFCSVYMMVMFRTILSTTEGLHKYFQKESVDQW